MAWLAKYGIADPVCIPRAEVTRGEVRAALSSRLVSTYLVTADDEDGPLKVARGAGHELEIVVSAGQHGCTSIAIGHGARGRDARKIRRLLRSAPELRVQPQKTVLDDKGGIPDSTMSLLSVYSGSSAHTRRYSGRCRLSG
jgi:hypothetical protein